MRRQSEDRYKDFARQEGQKGQRVISKEDRVRINELRKRRYKKRRRIRFISFLSKSTMLFFLVLLIGAFLFKIKDGLLDHSKNDPNNRSDLSIEQESNEVLQNKIGKPRIRVGNELVTRLKDLSKQDQKFEEIYYNRDSYPEALIASLCNNPEMIDFVKGYLTADQKVTGTIKKKELSKPFPLLLQWDKRWGYASYGDNNIALSGCAPTCLSMVAVALTKNGTYTPDVVSNYAMSSGYYISGTGTKWSLMTEGGQRFGVKGKSISLNKKTVITELDKGNPIICSVRAGDFTTSGHFIVLVGVRDGKIQVNDPNCIERSNRLWDYDTLSSQIKNLWVFTKL